MNGGNCPFIPRKYKTATFLHDWYRDMEVEIISDIDVRPNKDGDSWIFEFKLGKIIE